MARRGASHLLLAGFFVLIFSAGPAISQTTVGETTAQEVGYLRSLPDLPLMPGLTELPEAGFAFDKPAGRLVEAYAAGALDRASLQQFYEESLPQLGWRKETGKRYRREGELLDLFFLGADGDLIVRFTLRPE